MKKNKMRKFNVIGFLVTVSAELQASVLQQSNERPFPRNVKSLVVHSNAVAHFLSTAENPMYLNVALRHLKKIIKI